ncbi:MAG: hypothetical protein AAFY98_07580 [Verrucomicrobiota bacterium]
MNQRVLLIGLRADAVDYEKWDKLSPEKLEAAFTEVITELEEAGYQPQWCLTDTGATACEQIQSALKETEPEIVLIGAGVRADGANLFLFEKVINLVHEHAPQAKICFNRLPYDSLDAVKRWS